MLIYKNVGSREVTVGENLGIGLTEETGEALFQLQYGLARQ